MYPQGFGFAPSGRGLAGECRGQQDNPAARTALPSWGEKQDGTSSARPV